MARVQLASLGAGVAQNRLGAVAANRSGTIYLHGTTDPVDVYAAEVGGSPDSSGTFVTDALGKIPGWVAAGIAMDITIPPAATITAYAGGAFTVPLVNKSGDFTFAQDEAETRVQASSSSAIVATIPPNASVAFPVGTSIEIARRGTGTVTLAPGSGVTINSPDGALGLAVQFSSAVLVKVGTNEWDLAGDIA